MTATTWTVVYQPSRFSPHLQQTGAVGTWEAMSEYYQTSTDERLVNAHAAFLVPSDATEQEVETGRTLKIARTAEQKAAETERAAKIRTLVAANDRSGFRLLEKWGGRLVYRGELREAASVWDIAAVAVDRGMNYSAICQVLS